MWGGPVVGSRGELGESESLHALSSPEGARRRGLPASLHNKKPARENFLRRLLIG